MEENKSFDLWCLVELFGHQKIAGRCTEQNIAGTNMLRVDVPETTKQPAFTRLFGSAAIYAINPVDEPTAKFYAEKLEVAPIESWRVGEFIKKHNELLLTGSQKSSPTNNEDDDYNEDDDI